MEAARETERLSAFLGPGFVLGRRLALLPFGDSRGRLGRWFNSTPAYYQCVND
jgi:hypothetical protein